MGKLTKKGREKTLFEIKKVFLCLSIKDQEALIKKAKEVKVRRASCGL